jgi:hypothetical protein
MRGTEAPDRLRLPSMNVTLSFALCYATGRVFGTSCANVAQCCTNNVELAWQQMPSEPTGHDDLFGISWNVERAGICWPDAILFLVLEHGHELLRRH